jgi:hypothetical protein
MFSYRAIGEGLGDAITINEPNEESNYNLVLNNTSNISLKEMKVTGYGVVNESPAIDFKKIKLKYDVAVVFALK